MLNLKQTKYKQISNTYKYLINSKKWQAIIKTLTINPSIQILINQIIN